MALVNEIETGLGAAIIVLLAYLIGGYCVIRLYDWWMK